MAPSIATARGRRASDRTRSESKETVRALSLAVLLGLAACGDHSSDDARTPDAGERPDAGSRGALSATLRKALEVGDLAAAEAALERLQRDHEGAGEMPDGRTLSAEAMSGAVF